MIRPANLYDQPYSFGWISIALHWLSALLIIGLWILGKSIEFQAVGEVAERRSLHVTLGLAVWLLLAVRIYWRLRSPHPRAPGQSELTHRLARLAHFLMLVLLSIMLLSGPLLAWTLTRSPGLANAAHGTHGLAANLLALLVLLHIGAALKHLMFHDDETLARIFKPRRASPNDVA